MSVVASAISPQGQHLAEAEVRAVLERSLADRFAGRRILVLIPDGTRSIPLPMLFRHLTGLLADAAELTFMAALGTHQPMSRDALLAHVGLAYERDVPANVRLVNHAWHEPDTFVSLGRLPRERIMEIAGDRWHPTLGGDVDVRINRAALEHDHILIVGPTFPHEVVGFSGGAKYLFPGISGQDMINVTHWLGALSGVRGTIGISDTPVRAMIHAAADLVPTDVTLVALVVERGGLGGIFVGDHVEAWRQAAELSGERHIVWVDRPFHLILSAAPPMYADLWTAGKAMYKLEPALAEGGELIIHAPHLRDVSVVHGDWIRRIGYHVLPYFLEQWDRFSHVPLGILAHSTHVRGDGRFEGGIEHPRATVTLASRLGRGETEALALAWRDPAAIDPARFAGREDEGVLYVPRAGEILYRARTG